jgi:ABC-type uncharacterized transport system ATPase subunit
MAKALELKNITKQFPGVLANDRISMDLREAEVHTLLGENGAGKTTLMNILYGLLRPDEGNILIHGKVCHIGSPKEAIAMGIGMVHQHFMLVPTLTVTENIELGQELVRWNFLRKREAARQIAKLSSDYSLEVNPNAKIWQLSVGEQQRVEILKMLYRGADILILDEPTASLSPNECIVFFDIIRSMINRGKSVIFISHKLEEVLSISDRITVLRKGKVIGTVNRAETNKKDLARMMVGRDVVLRVSGEHRSSADKTPVVSLQNISIQESREKFSLENVNLDIYQGEILGVAGVDGNGQMELAEIIAGLRQPSFGAILIDGANQSANDPSQRIELGVYYIPAKRKKRGAAMSLPIYMNAILKNHRYVPYSKKGILNHRIIRAFTTEQVKAYDIRCPSIDAITDTLSGGNLQKLILAREISGKPKILIAENPTRGLDVGATEYVRGLLLKQRDEGCAIVLISCDLDEILALSDRIVVMYEGKFVYETTDPETSLDEIGLAIGGALKA